MAQAVRRLRGAIADGDAPPDAASLDAGGAEARDPEGGRIFFSGAGRSLVEEDEIVLTSVGIDIGSATSHLMLSRITLERLDTRYVVAERAVLHASDIWLTPYRASGDIDAEALGRLIEGAFASAGMTREAVDTGSLILTGVAVLRRNAEAVGRLFAAEAGRFVAVSAGDRLEALMAAHGSGAVAASRGGMAVLNIDVGGGTTKIALCRDGEVAALTSVEAGARLVVVDAVDRVIRIEPTGAAMAEAMGHPLRLGDACSPRLRARLGLGFAMRIGRAIAGREDASGLRLPGLPEGLAFDAIVFSGGVSEYINGQGAPVLGDLGPDLARALGELAGAAGMPVLRGPGGIRATAIGAAMHTVQVSGSTIFFDPAGTLPLRDLAVIAPALRLEVLIDPVAVAREVRLALAAVDLADGRRPVAVALAWRGSATWARLDALGRGLVAGLADVLAMGHPLVVVADGDVGGLLGMHCREADLADNAVVTIDGIALSALDRVDIGRPVAATGAVPVVVKSLLFPGAAA